MGQPAEIFDSNRMGRRGRLQIPKTVRDHLELKPGVLVLFMKDSEGKIFLRKAPRLKKKPEKKLGTYR